VSQQPTDPRAIPPSSTPSTARVRPQRRALPPFRVVLLNNTTQDMMFIVRTIMELTRLCRAEATHKMWEAHHCGRSVLLVTHKERAELFAEQFASKGLTTTVEPA
jgi:ATP-dependent Clp protease adapter protein ClpS